MNFYNRDRLFIQGTKPSLYFTVYFLLFWQATCEDHYPIYYQCDRPFIVALGLFQGKHGKGLILIHHWNNCCQYLGNIQYSTACLVLRWRLWIRLIFTDSLQESNVFSRVCLSVCLFTGNVPIWPLPMMPLVSHRSHGDPLNMFKVVDWGPCPGPSPGPVPPPFPESWPLPTPRHD